MADPMPTIIDTLRGAAVLRKAELGPRAGLVGMFERHADWHDGKAWIPVETAADLVLDGEDEQVQAVVRHVEAIIRLCYPDDMTPNAKRMFERALREYKQ